MKESKIEANMAKLRISDGKKEKVLQIEGIFEGNHRLYDLCFVGFLTASVV